MQDNDLPFYRTITFKFLTSTAIFIVLIELALLILSVQGMENRLHTIRSMVLDSIPQESSIDTSEILPNEQIEKIVDIYTRNIIIMVFVIITVVLTGLYFVVNRLFISPLKLLLKKNEETRSGEAISLVKEEKMPRSEMGIIMKSRNEMLNTINTLYNEQALETLREAVDAKDEYTEGHSRRVGKIGMLLGRKMKLSDEKCEELEYAGLLHDVGKIGVDDSILTKDGKLTDEEFEEIKAHPVRGEKIIQFGSISDQVLEGVRHHHEEYDGSGYPDGLESNDIPLYGRILAVADAMDAMLSNRHYRNALEYNEVESELRDNKGTQFDPDIAEIALDIIEPENRDVLPKFN